MVLGAVPYVVYFNIVTSYNEPIRGGAPLKMAKHIPPPPVTTKRSGLIDISLIRMYTKFERKNDQKLTFFFHKHQNISLLVKLLVRESSIKISAHPNSLRHALVFKYYFIMSKRVSLKFCQIQIIKTLPFHCKRIVSKTQVSVS